MLNIGCGAKFHPEWVNIDITSAHPSVIKYDIRKGLPFPDETFDAVYSSHLLEHLSYNEAESLMKEKYRVLKRGGICRIAVPDLEQICKNYLFYLTEMKNGNKNLAFRYKYALLELFDQITRTSSGGELGKLWQSGKNEDREYIISRHGNEVFRQNASKINSTNNNTIGIKEIYSVLKEKIHNRLLKLLLGQEKYRMLNEALFRNSGEIHMNMYDSFSLIKLLNNTGFINTAIVSPFESKIKEFNRFMLDVIDGEIRKPDSIFAEGVKN